MNSSLIDPFGRHIQYLRLSVTDRCDFRCVYCMAEEMKFIPRKQVLSLEELLEISEAFVELGVRKIRLTGGEPLVRNNLLWLAQQLGQLPKLEILALSTNAARLKTQIVALHKAGVSRVNISLDSLKPQRFSQLTRTGQLSNVIAGIDAAIKAGITAVKINSVILRGRNDDEIIDLLEFALKRNINISFIEEMPLGTITEHSRQESYLSSQEIIDVIETRYSLVQSLANKSTAGPSRLYTIPGHSSKIGFISPHSHNFCDLCNRIRVTATGKLLLCLGHENSLDLKKILRRSNYQRAYLKEAIVEALQLKPERHQFEVSDQPQVIRFMNATGG